MISAVETRVDIGLIFLQKVSIVYLKENFSAVHLFLQK